MASLWVVFFLLWLSVVVADEKYLAVVKTGPIDAVVEAKGVAIGVREGYTDDLPPFKDFNGPIQVRVFGICGMYNKGKSWFLNGVFKKEFLSGATETTQGISIAYVAEDVDMGNYWLILDSAGTQATIQFDNKDGQDRLKLESLKVAEQEMMENFMFDMIAKAADFLVFMVNDYTWLEQHISFNLQKNLKKDCDKKPDTEDTISVCTDKYFLTVHNYKEVHEKETLFDLFRTQVTNNDDGTEEESDVAQWKPADHLHFRIDFSDSVATSHIAFMNNDSDDGKIINPIQFQKIRERAKQGIGVPRNHTKFSDLFRVDQALNEVVSCSGLEEGMTLPIATVKVESAEETKQFDKYSPEYPSKLMMKIQMPGNGRCRNKKIPVLDNSAELKLEGGGPFTSVYKVRGWGKYSQMVVYQIDAPGLTAEDILFKKNDETENWEVELNRGIHPRLRNVDIMTRAEREQNPSYEQDYVRGKAWPVKAGAQGDIYLRNKTSLKTLDQFKRMTFKRWTRPSLRCLYEVAHREGKEADVNNMDSPPLNVCKPYSFDKGILFIFAGEVDTNSVNLGEENARRRRASFAL
jgi:hypothetical protein